jgi:hypothetical protein
MQVQPMSGDIYNTMHHVPKRDPGNAVAPQVATGLSPEYPLGRVAATPLQRIRCCGFGCSVRSLLRMISLAACMDVCGLARRHHIPNTRFCGV